MKIITFIVFLILANLAQAQHPLKMVNPVDFYVSEFDKTGTFGNVTDLKIGPNFTAFLTYYDSLPGDVTAIRDVTITLTGAEGAFPKDYSGVVPIQCMRDHPLGEISNTYNTLYGRGNPAVVTPWVMSVDTNGDGSQIVLGSMGLSEFYTGFYKGTYYSYGLFLTDLGFGNVIANAKESGMGAVLTGTYYLPGETIPAIPEPSTYTMVGASLLAGLGVLRRR